MPRHARGERNNARKCACDAPIVDGRCSPIDGTPSCADFKKPRMKLLQSQRRLRDRERRETSARTLPGYYEVRAAAERAVPGPSAESRRRQFGSLMGDPQP